MLSHIELLKRRDLRYRAEALMSFCTFADQVPALTALLQSSHAEQAASELLRLTQGSQEDRKAIIAAGALPAVVSLLASAQFVVQQRSAAALGALAADSLQVREFIVVVGALPPLIHLLSSAQPTVQEHAAAALAALLNNSQQTEMPALQQVCCCHC